jgi:hypothetical protein
MRALVALLLLANLLFLALARDWLQPLAGLSTQQQREPQRLAAQLHPETVRVLTPEALAAACQQAGPFDPAQAAAAETTLAQVLPAGSWRRVPGDAAGDTARVWLRVEPADAALRARLQTLSASWPGQGFVACRP